MKELKPFRSLPALKKALDNGGRFFSFFDRAADDKVSRAELARAAGVFSAGIQAFLYLEMTKQDLSEEQQAEAVSMLEPTLQASFAKKKPPHAKPSMVDKNYKAGDGLIVTGYGRELETQKRFEGFIIVPIMVGKAMIPMMIPINNIYQVIEIYDDATFRSPRAIVCVPQKKKVDLSGQVQFGGVLKELKNQTTSPPTHPVFLEAIFWMKR